MALAPKTAAGASGGDVPRRTWTSRALTSSPSPSSDDDLAGSDSARGVREATADPVWNAEAREERANGLTTNFASGTTNAHRTTAGITSAHPMGLAPKTAAGASDDDVPRRTWTSRALMSSPSPSSDDDLAGSDSA